MTVALAIPQAVTRTVTALFTVTVPVTVSLTDSDSEAVTVSAGPSHESLARHGPGPARRGSASLTRRGAGPAPGRPGGGVTSPSHLLPRAGEARGGPRRATGTEAAAAGRAARAATSGVTPGGPAVPESLAA